MQRCVFAFFIAFLVVGAMFRWTGTERSVGSGPEEIAAWADRLMLAERARPRGLMDQEEGLWAVRVGEGAVGNLRDAAALKAAAYAVKRRLDEIRARDAGDRDAERGCRDLRSMLLIQVASGIRYRLAAIGSPEAAEALVSLFADSGFGYDGESSLLMLDAVCVCGRPALPYLRRIVDGHSADWAREAEGLIERGQGGF